MDNGLGFNVHWQDYRQWFERGNIGHPPRYTETFQTIDAADYRKLVLKEIGILACVVPVPTPRSSKSVPVVPIGRKRFNKEWKHYG